MKIDIKKFNNAVKEYYGEIRDDDNARFKSWEHCYNAFKAQLNSNTPDYDYLALHLALYLASWGMLRNSFLMQKDYKIHVGAIKILLTDKYKKFYNISCDKLLNELADLNELLKELRDYYSDIKKTVTNYDGINPKEKITDTLLSKVLLGTMGCVPAYDRYFVKAIRKYSEISGTLNVDSIKGLCEFYNENKNDIAKVCKELNIKGYPDMKIIDMGLWQMGLDLEKKEKKSKK